MVMSSAMRVISDRLKWWAGDDMREMSFMETTSFEETYQSDTMLFCKCLVGICRTRPEMGMSCATLMG